MNIEQAFEIAQAVLLSIGGASVILFMLSNWLGKVWANRMMVNDRAKHASDLAELSSKLKKEADYNNHLLMQKIALYKEVANPVIELIVKAQHEPLTPSDLQAFDKDRLSTTALLSMFAPSPVFNEYNNMIDYIYDAVEEKQQWGFDIFRGKALIFLSEVRRDIGLYDDNVFYSGTR
jgi:hypothetical protein